MTTIRRSTGTWNTLACSVYTRRAITVRTLYGGVRRRLADHGRLKEAKMGGGSIVHYIHNSRRKSLIFHFSKNIGYFRSAKPALMGPAPF